MYNYAHVLKGLPVVTIFRREATEKNKDLVDSINGFLNM